MEEFVLLHVQIGKHEKALKALKLAHRLNHLLKKEEYKVSVRYRTLCTHYIYILYLLFYVGEGHLFGGGKEWLVFTW